MLNSFEHLEFIQKIIIPKYITKVKTSDKTRKKYYRQTKKGKQKPRTFPKTYQAKLDEGIWSLNKSNRRLMDEHGEYVLANPRKAGKPNYEPLSGNRFTSGFGSYHVRNTLVDGLHDFYRPLIKEQLVPIKKEDFPIQVFWELHTTIDPPNFDLSNFWFYFKYFEDTLLEEDLNPKIIPDDSVRYISKPAAPELYPIRNWEDRKFVISFYKDNRTIFNNYEQYSNF